MSLANMKRNETSVKVTQHELPYGIIFKNKHLITEASNWHKLIVLNAANYHRDYILRVIIDHIHPLDLIPVCYTRDGPTASFFARNCAAAIQKLCKDNLSIPDPKTGGVFLMNLILAHGSNREFKIDAKKNVLFALNKRLDKSKKILDLRKFHEDPDLTEFSPLSQPKIMYYVLYLAKSLTPIPSAYMLQDNYIRTLESINALGSVVSFVNTFDLRNNSIKTIKDLTPLKHFKIKHLLLDGNPLCRDYDAVTYVKEITKLIPSLETLDGIHITTLGHPVNNFLCEYEGLNLVNQFLEHYYTLYDSRNRQSLEPLYHSSALFSMNCQYHPNQISSNSARIFSYNNISRNLSKLADASRNNQFLFKGPKEIVNALSNLPPTEHDPFSFRVDLIHYTSYCAVISVSGILREQPENLLDIERIYGFHRTFVIEIINGNGECLITNDMMHVHNAFNNQMLTAFKVNQRTDISGVRFPSNEKEQQKLIEAVRIITGLNAAWSKKCLEECSFNLRRTLELFIKYYKPDNLPKEAFVNVNLKNMN